MSGWEADEVSEVCDILNDVVNQMTVGITEDLIDDDEFPDDIKEKVKMLAELVPPPAPPPPAEGNSSPHSQTLNATATELSSSNNAVTHSTNSDTNSMNLDDLVLPKVTQKPVDLSDSDNKGSPQPPTPTQGAEPWASDASSSAIGDGNGDDSDNTGSEKSKSSSSQAVGTTKSLRTINLAPDWNVKESVRTTPGDPVEFRDVCIICGAHEERGYYYKRGFKCLNCRGVESATSQMFAGSSMDLETSMSFAREQWPNFAALPESVKRAIEIEAKYLSLQGDLLRGSIKQRRRDFRASIQSTHHDYNPQGFTFVQRGLLPHDDEEATDEEAADIDTVISLGEMLDNGDLTMNDRYKAFCLSPICEDVIESLNDFRTLLHPNIVYVFATTVDRDEDCVWYVHENLAPLLNLFSKDRMGFEPSSQDLDAPLSFRGLRYAKVATSTGGGGGNGDSGKNAFDRTDSIGKKVHATLMAAQQKEKSQEQRRVNFSATNTLTSMASIDSDEAHRLQEAVKNIKRNLTLSEGLEEFRAVAYSLVTALSVIHNQGYVHGDVRPGNILFDNSKHMTKLRFCPSYKPLPDPYCPPEFVEGGYKPTMAGDMYTLGITLRQLLYGSDSVLSYPPVPQRTEDDDSFIRLFERLTAPDPANRIGAYDALKETEALQLTRTHRGAPVVRQSGAIAVLPAVKQQQVLIDSGLHPEPDVTTPGMRDQFTQFEASVAISSRSLPSDEVSADDTLPLLLLVNPNNTAAHILFDFISKSGPYYQVVARRGSVTLYSLTKDPRLRRTTK